MFSRVLNFRSPLNQRLLPRVEDNAAALDGLGPLATNRARGCLPPRRVREPWAGPSADRVDLANEFRMGVLGEVPRAASSTMRCAWLASISPPQSKKGARLGLPGAGGSPGTKAWGNAVPEEKNLDKCH